MTDVIALEKLAVGYYPSKSDSFKPHRSVLIRGGGSPRCCGSSER